MTPGVVWCLLTPTFRLLAALCLCSVIADRASAAERIPRWVEIRSPQGCCGYLPLFDTRPAAEAWAAGRFEVVEFRVVPGPAGYSAGRAVC